MIFDNISDRLKSSSISLAYLLLFTWCVIVKKVLRDAWFDKKKIQRDVWLEPPFATLIFRPILEIHAVMSIIIPHTWRTWILPLQKLQTASNAG